MTLTRSSSSKGFSKNSVAPPFIAFTVVGMSSCPVRKLIGGPSLFAKRVCNSNPVMPGRYRSRMRDMCLNLDGLDGIFIEMVVEERETGKLL
jgi:hypothetical protein